MPDLQDRWTHAAAAQSAERPARVPENAAAAIPEVDASDSGQASVDLSKHRTDAVDASHRASEHRTALSEHRTDLSIYRTDLSTERTEMSMRRTGMRFRRTRMSADRTLMSVIRTSLSLISFGFTIFQVFEKLRDQDDRAPARQQARNFGTALVALGIAHAGPRHHLSPPVHDWPAPRCARRWPKTASSTQRAASRHRFTLITASCCC